MVLGEMKMSPVSPAIITETENRVKIKSAQIDGNDFNQTCGELERFLISQDYQRISGYMSYGGPESNRQEAVCEAIKLRDTLTPLTEDINLPFVDDQTVIGRWEAIGEFAVKQDFFAEKFVDRRWFGDSVREIYFLPDGERYWCDEGAVDIVLPRDLRRRIGGMVELSQHQYRRTASTAISVGFMLDKHIPASFILLHLIGIDRRTVSGLDQQISFGPAVALGTTISRFGPEAMSCANGIRRPAPMKSGQ